ncbi:hypothetical protein GTP46_00575 [Duganella sp. FT135W]|uniref:Uncharacterized protein n=1 Tax=Duganella flavida TaxID=2692175 RepID=A0A6L8K5C4_9BURK|nr:hypothetical protein [Duganella flavida]MYM21142.1 hypothetical protein [Duganella flavida]
MFSISAISSSSSASSDAYQDFLQKKVELAKKNAAALDALSQRADQDQKALARQRVVEIKKEIESLRKMLALFGGKDAKALLQQLKQLASQLKQASGILRATPDSSVPDDPSAGKDSSDGYAAYAEQQASADAEAAGSTNVQIAPPDMQRAEDDKLLEGATQALKSLKSTAERLVKQQEGRA